MDYSYEYIKQRAKELHCRAEDLIVLAPKNDPFYVGTPSDLASAHWFAGLWQRFGYAQNVHVRRIHYQVVSQDPPVEMPNGKPYENTEKCWDFLSDASAAARYLKLVDASAFVDRRNPQPYLSEELIEERAIGIWTQGFEIGTLPDFPDIPDYAAYGYDLAPQPYHLEIWCEKSTMNDVLRPLCQRYGVQFVTGLGELSITATLKAVQRVALANKPARIFYVSDFDPAGECMPVSVARKMEYFIRQMDASIDLRLFPVMLTGEQVETYQLPTTPIKDGEKRKDRFEQRHGGGGVELDALEALRPGTLERLLVQHIRQYYDVSLAVRTRAVKQRLVRDLAEKRQQIIARYAPVLRSLQEEYEEIQSGYAERVAHVSDQVAALWDTIDTEMRDAMPSVDDYPLPAGHLALDEATGMFDSLRDYEAQVAAFKKHQGKDTAPAPRTRKAKKAA